MKHRTRSQTIAEHKLSSTFDKLGSQLRSGRDAEQLERPLAYWALATDRRLPLVLLGRPLRDIVESPFSELCTTPGVGTKKIHSLITLLTRAAAEPPHKVPARDGQKRGGKHAAAATSEPVFGSPEFNPLAVSETIWARWRAAICRHGLEQQALGRYSPTLADLQRVMWNTPLSAYTGMTLAEIRALRTHGEKRVRGVINVFAAVNQALGEHPAPPHLQLRIVNSFASRLEAWAGAALDQSRLPSLTAIRRELAEPIVEQVRTDAGNGLAALVQGRLGLKGGGSSARHAANRMGVTRARVYQLLDDISEMLQVRWPESSRWLGPLAERSRAMTDQPAESRLLQAAADLFFVPRRTSASQAIDRNGAR